jgi:hypothetical protein
LLLAVGVVIAFHACRQLKRLKAIKEITMSFTARYPGECYVCRERFDAGAEVAGSVGRYRHDECSEDTSLAVEDDPWAGADDDPGDGQPWEKVTEERVKSSVQTVIDDLGIVLRDDMIVSSAEETIAWKTSLHDESKCGCDGCYSFRVDCAPPSIW